MLVASLSAYGARTLATYERRGALHSEVLEFLSALYNGEMRPRVSSSNLGRRPTPDAAAQVAIPPPSAAEGFTTIPRPPLG